ncbi:MAG TPA: sugar transferase [Candidatus Dormibacteraeota bacterium]|nr:sugar transferase [Candidatus Dormibacteraeota bacterium]
MGRRLFDIGAATAALIVLSPLMLLVAIAIRMSSAGPVIFRAPRVGLHGRLFSMFKFRTMLAVTGEAGSAITGNRDPRVYPLGRLLRRSKIDELPQLLNVLRGEMALVGPRPEDPGMVAAWYRAEHQSTLDVRPGLASPGSLYNFTHGEVQLAGPDAEAAYIERVLPVKLALDVVYVRRASFGYDLTVVLRTLFVIVAAGLGKRRFGEPPEMAEALELATGTPARARAAPRSQPDGVL